MKKQILIAFHILAIAMILNAQTVAPKLQFETTSHDFGKIPDNQKVTYQFKLKNTGSQPLIITNVQAACGCTTPNWPKNPLVPGASATIDVEFNPAGYRAFSKTITVYSNSEPNSVVLTISGEAFSPNNPVVAVDEDKEKFKARMGNLGLVSTHIGFGNIFPQDVKKNVVEIKNMGTTPLNIGFFSVPDHITIKAVPEVLAPNAKGLIEVTFNGAKKNDWDYIFDRVYVTFDGQRNFDNTLNITAIITEDFNKLSDAERQNAPVISIENANYDFGEIKAGTQVKMSFKLTNNGKMPLVIRKVKASCGCTAAEPKEMVILPGKFTLVESVFDSTGRTGDQSKSITIITNDPKNSRSVIWIKGKVTN